MLLNKTIRLFLDSIGRREEYEFYLNKFQSAGTDCFALLVPDLDSLEQGAEALAFDLRFLLQLGLKPAVVLCGADAETQWNLLKDNPLFERTVFPKLGRRKVSVPVFVDTGLQPLESLQQKVPAVARRVHFIRAAGGLSVDYYYTQKPLAELSSDDKALAAAAAALLEARPGTHISVTAPMNLLEEIFTVKGAGTVFRRGSTILSGGAPDLDRLLALLQESFGKKPKEGILALVAQIYFEENYRGAALLEKHPEGLYLSKFAVGSEARGEGLAQELWDEVCRNHPAFFWRSRKGNPINQWYDRQADGRHTAGDWMIFWRGMDATSIPGFIAFCSSRPADFVAGP
jgi:ribosomal protein S18 acetylase RimI-like enzyme